MCGRFTLTLAHLEQLSALLGAEADPTLSPLYRPRWNVAPGDMHWIQVVAHAPKSELWPAMWGLFGSVTLARAEGVATRFADAFEHRRCVVPVDGFFEWGGPKNHRVPWWFSPVDERPSDEPGTPEHGRAVWRTPEQVLRLGGIYTRTRAGAAFAIITTAANDVVSPVHDRMPLVLSQATAAQWLDPSTPVSTLHQLLRPAAAEALAARPVGPRVNSARNDDPSCLDVAQVVQQRLF